MEHHLTTKPKILKIKWNIKFHSYHKFDKKAIKGIQNYNKSNLFVFGHLLKSIDNIISSWGLE